MVMPKKDYSATTTALRNLMLKHMSMETPISSRDLSAMILKLNPKAKAKPTNLDYHLSFMVPEKFVQQVRMPSRSPRHDNEFQYLKLKDNYVMPEIRTGVIKRTAKAKSIPDKFVFAGNPFRNYAC
jgi:hypothetical protein